MGLTSLYGYQRRLISSEEYSSINMVVEKDLANQASPGLTICTGKHWHQPIDALCCPQSMNSLKKLTVKCGAIHEKDQPKRS
jgi:hypothetical protein